MLVRISYISLGVGAVIFLITFLAYWLPFYVAGAGGQAFLFPVLAITVLPLVGVACLLSLICAAVALSRESRAGDGRSGRSLIIAIVLSGLLFVSAGPLLYAGNLLAALWGADVIPTVRTDG
ncbi:MAG: hypothetical protein QM598_08730 [Protaetiibacter sp.]